MRERKTVRTAGPKRPTLADVARRAAVAPVTVSRAINTPELVNAETLERITEAVEALGYQVNPAARALAGSKWNTVGVLVPSLDHIMFQHQLAVFEAEMAARNISLLISATNYDPESELRAVSGLVTRGIDAILLTHVDCADETHRILNSAGMPRVLMGSHGRDHFPVWCGYDDRLAMRSVVDHVLKLGHRNIGMLGDSRAVTNGLTRVTAVKERLVEAGMVLKDDMLAWCGPDEEDAHVAFANLMDLPSPPTALICGNDDLALSALSEALSLGIRVPSDVAITGFDGADITAHPAISLSTVRCSWRMLGIAAADLIVSEIEGRPSSPILVPTELIVRRSTVDQQSTTD